MTGFSVGDGNMGRAERRAVIGHDVQPATDLAIARMGERVYLGIRHGGRVRLTRAEARQLAGELLELADPEPGRPSEVAE